MNNLILSALRGAPGALLPAALLLSGCSGDSPSGADSTDPLETETSADEGSSGPESEPGPDSRRSRDTALGGNATGVHACEDSYEHYEDPTAGRSQLHVIAIHDAAGPVDVRVSRRGSSVLVLSSYEPTAWNITTSGDASIQRVILSSASPSTATVPDGVPVEVHSFEGGNPLPGIGATLWPSVGTAQLVEVTEELTGRTLTSFRSCGRSARFDIERPREIRPPHRVTDRREPTVLAGCEALTAESNYCMVNAFDQLIMVGLDTGTICRGDQPINGPDVFHGSLGWQGDYVYGCDLERGIVRVSVVDGTADVAPLGCSSVTSDDGNQLIGFVATDGDNPLGGLARFTFKQAAAGEVGKVFDLDPFATRLAVNGDQGWYSWHSTPTVETSELKDGAPIETVTLEGFDDWVQGIDETDDGRLVIAGTITGETIFLFDAATGAAQGTIPLSSDDQLVFANGVACEAGGR